MSNLPTKLYHSARNRDYSSILEFLKENIDHSNPDFFIDADFWISLFIEMPKKGVLEDRLKLFNFLIDYDLLFTNHRINYLLSAAFRIYLKSENEIKQYYQNIINKTIDCLIKKNNLKQIKQSLIIDILSHTNPALLIKLNME